MLLVGAENAGEGTVAAAVADVFVKTCLLLVTFLTVLAIRVRLESQRFD